MEICTKLSDEIVEALSLDELNKNSIFLAVEKALLEIGNAEIKW